jgi:hypothetical protein
MNVTNALGKIIVVVLGVGCIQYLISSESIRAAGSKPRVPVIGGTYTLGGLWNEINANNPKKNSNFIVALNGQTPIPASACWPNGVNLNGSAGAHKVGLDLNYIKANAGVSVTLKQDTTLVDYLVSSTRLQVGMKDKYSKILLYFELNGYRFYLNDPFPGKMVRTAVSSVNPAGNIIGKWDFGSQFKPDAR